MNAQNKIIYRGGWKDNLFDGEGREVLINADSYFMG